MCATVQLGGCLVSIYSESIHCAGPQGPPGSHLEQHSATRQQDSSPNKVQLASAVGKSRSMKYRFLTDFTTASRDSLSLWVPFSKEGPSERRWGLGLWTLGSNIVSLFQSALHLLIDLLSLQQVEVGSCTFSVVLQVRVCM